MDRRKAENYNQITMKYAPIHAKEFDTKLDAVNYAIDKTKFNDFTLYLFFRTDGKWIVDQQAEFYSNERHEGTFSQGERSDGAQGAAVGQRSVDTNAEAREIIAECKRRVYCLCGLECKLTIEEVRSSREGHL